MKSAGVRSGALVAAAVSVLIQGGCATAPRPGGAAAPAAQAAPLADLQAFAVPRDQRPTLMVQDFDYSAVSANLAPEHSSGLAALAAAVRGNAGDQERSESSLGAGVSTLAIEKLLEAGQFRVMERSQLTSILAEQDLAASGRAAPGQAAAVRQAQVLGAQYLLTGAITKVGFEERTRGVGLGGRGLGGVGAVGQRQQRTLVTVTARLVDTSTGEIVASVTGEGVSELGGGLVLGGGARTGGLAVGSSTSNIKETAIGEAVDMAVHNLIGGLAERWARVR
jgi:curli biogenesis system outer membrane secretion channel CsgG